MYSTCTRSPVAICKFVIVLVVLLAGTVWAAPLEVSLQDAVLGGPLPETQIDAYALKDNGSLAWRARGYTDHQGRLRLELQGLDSGQVFLLRARNPFGTGDVYSNKIYAPGDFVFAAGNLKLKFVSGIDGRQPLADKRVYLRQKQGDGYLKGYRHGTTNAAGEVRFHAAGLEQGVTYVPRAPSPVDGHWKYGAAISKAGTHIIPVGEVLAVKLRDTLDESAGLAGKEIIAYQVLADGKLRWRKRSYTDGQGNLLLDLDGLGRDEIYRLRVRNPFGTGDVYSKDIENVGELIFKVGNLQLTLINGLDDQPVPQYPVYLKRQLDGGVLKSFRYGYTDPAGAVRFHLPDVDQKSESGVYVAKAKSLIDGYWRLSDPYTTNGRHQFVLGEPVTVVLKNALSDTTLPGKRIDVYELLPDGNLKWRRRGETDDQGQVLFDLDRISTGRPYVFKARQPFGTGDIYSRAVSTTGTFEFMVGTVAVSLVDADNDLALAGKKIYVYEKLPTGALKWAGYGYTGPDGQLHFHLPGQDEGKVYVFKIHNVFDDGRTCYSPLVRDKGPFDFFVYHEGDCSLDLTPPTVSIAEPGEEQHVNQHGFTVIMFADDDKQLDRVELMVSDPVAGAALIPAVNDSSTQRWTARVTAEMITLNQSVTLSARAVDRGANEATVLRKVLIVEDTSPPVITISSHSNNDQVPETGFLLSGNVTDDTGVESLTVILDDPVKGRTVDRPLEVAPGSGNWTLAVQSDMISAGVTVVITLTATDQLNMDSSDSLDLTVVTVDYLARHIINRITYGITPTLLQEVEGTGAAEFLRRQLDPAVIDDSAFENMIAGITPATTAELKVFALLHMIYSKRQLNEVMTQFWDNHFNTNVNKPGNHVSFELAENQAFRANALGRFRDLVGISAKSPAMIHYLDNISSNKSDANENYARELLELHTMGVDGGYTQEDIEAGAEILTGWHEQNGAFFFNADEHNFNSQEFLEVTIPAGGQEQGEALLNIVAAHRSTAEFICTKLSTLFVGDQAPAGLVVRCADTFQDTAPEADQMAQVVDAILTSPEFAANYRGKIKTPLELLVGLVRNFEADGDGSDLAGYLPPMGLNLFENPVPTGWSEVGPDWINSNLLLERIKFVNVIAFKPMDDDKTHLDPMVYFQKYNYETAEGIVGFLFDLLFDNDVSALDRTTALEVLVGDGDFSLSDPDAEQKLRQLLGTVLSYPQYQMQ